MARSGGADPSSGLVAAGVVSGQPYIFPGDWDDATAPWALAVETSRGVDFVEPLAVVAGPSAQFATRMQNATCDGVA